MGENAFVNITIPRETFLHVYLDSGDLYEEASRRGIVKVVLYKGGVAYEYSPDELIDALNRLALGTCEDIGSYVFKCSVCGYEVEDRITDPKYCPQCGRTVTQ